MTSENFNWILNNRSKMSIEEMSKKLNTNRVNIVRFLRKNNLLLKGVTDPSKLTPSEEKIYLLITKECKSYKEIAQKLYISKTTVKTHVNNIFQKKRVNSYGHLIWDFYTKEMQKIKVHYEQQLKAMIDKYNNLYNKQKQTP